MDNELSVRKPGEVIGRTVREDGSPQDREASRLVILIHGYQNSEDKAGDSFERFRARLRSATEGGERRIGAIWEFHWPGDHPVGPISVATYGIRVGVARIAGDLLATRWLARRRRDQSVVIVAHSLGCRVAMEAVQAILEEGDDYSGARVSTVFLLAAAVPVSLCEPGETFSRSVQTPAEHVFHSRSDRVLQTLFVPGQYMVGEYGPAVGRHGHPANRWTSLHDTGLAHRRYWKSADVAERICELLGLRAWRTIDPRLLPVVEPLDDRRRLEEQRLAQRVPPTRFA